MRTKEESVRTTCEARAKDPRLKMSCESLLNFRVHPTAKTTQQTRETEVPKGQNSRNFNKELGTYGFLSRRQHVFPSSGDAFKTRQMSSIRWEYKEKESARVTLQVRPFVLASTFAFVVSGEDLEIRGGIIRHLYLSIHTDTHSHILGRVSFCHFSQYRRQRGFSESNIFPGLDTLINNAFRSLCSRVYIHTYKQTNG